MSREEQPFPESGISLNKYISSQGICSRREADKLIEKGRVKINDKIAQKGNRVMEGDKVSINDKLLPQKSKKKPIYLLFNKPKGVVCTTSKKDKNNIIDFLDFPVRIFPIGRLDKDSTGLILLTNDGDIVNKILRSSNEHEKEYEVTVNKNIDDNFLHHMAKGVPILGTITLPAKVKKTGKNSFSIVLTQGLNRQIRRMCEQLGYRVEDLKRTRIMHITDPKLAEGKYRPLHPSEFKKLMSATEHSIKYPKHK